MVYLNLCLMLQAEITYATTACKAAMAKQCISLHCTSEGEHSMMLFCISSSICCRLKSQQHSMQSSTGQAAYMAALCTCRGTQHDAGLHQQFNVQSLMAGMVYVHYCA